MRTVSTQRGLAELRRVTEHFIADDPTIIVLTPHSKVSDGCGGYLFVPETPRVSQVFKVIAIPTSTDGIVESEGASSRKWDYVLLGKYDAEVEIGDSWTDGDSSYRVTGCMQENDYERRFSVIAFGKDPSYG